MATLIQEMVRADLAHVSGRVNSVLRCGGLGSNQHFWEKVRPHGGILEKLG